MIHLSSQITFQVKTTGDYIKSFLVKAYILDLEISGLSHLKKYKLIVTFNGKLFDIPFIRKLYPNINIPEIHIDLRYLLRSVGIDGPLKKIETRMGISRPPEISNLNGREAVVLWNRFLNGNNEDLEKTTPLQ